MKTNLILALALACLLSTATSAKAGSAGKADPAPEGPQIGTPEGDGLSALGELGIAAPEGNPRFLREAGLLKKYQKAWNDFKPTANELADAPNPENIVGFYTDGPGLLYRDMCMPQGLTSKAGLTRYLTAFYRKFPRQVWGDGWKNIRLFAGPRPGELAYYYRFALYRSTAAEAEPAMTGTGMERVAFDIDGKLISDEVHLIPSSGTATCKFGGD